jgi:glycosyltransferase involved in cell wall biosynthesis
MHKYSRWRGHQDLQARRQICQHAEVVLAISAAMRRYMIETEGILADRVFSFPMGFNEVPMLDTAGREALRTRLNLSEGRTLVYSGVLDPVREPGWMLDVLGRVNKKLPEAVLLVLTNQSESDPRRVQFEQEAARRGAHVRILGPLSHWQVGEYLQSADVMLSPINPIFEYRISSPTKSIEALGVGVPVVGNSEVEEHAVILNQSGGGISVPWDLTAFTDAAVRLLNDPDECRRMGALGRQWARQNRTYTRLTDYLEAILRAAHSVNALKKLPHLTE